MCYNIARDRRTKKVPSMVDIKSKKQWAVVSVDSQLSGPHQSRDAHTPTPNPKKKSKSKIKATHGLVCFFFIIASASYLLHPTPLTFSKVNHTIIKTKKKKENRHFSSLCTPVLSIPLFLSHLSIPFFNYKYFHLFLSFSISHLQKSAPHFVCISYSQLHLCSSPLRFVLGTFFKTMMKMMMMEEMEQEGDWDLQAVVRGFTATAAAATAAAEQELRRPEFCAWSSSCSVSKFVKEEESEDLFGRIEDPFEGIEGLRGAMGEGLEDLCKPFCSDLLQQSFKPTTTRAAAACSPESGVLGVFREQQQQQTPTPPAQEQQQLQQGQQLFLQKQPGQINQSQDMFGTAAATSLVSAGSTAQSQRIVTATPAPHTHRAKKRKNVMKKVCHVPAEGLSSGMWAWRKYGQKPIKGSPYPRGYYRCSSLKGCLARKQVERNRSDPKMFIVTYTGEHNHPMPTHRNSLAGSTRQKTISSQSQGGAAVGRDSGSPTSTSTITMTPPAQNNSSSPTTSNSPATEYEDLIKDDEDNDIGISDMILNDDIFAGFEDLDGLDPIGDCFPDQFTTSVEFPWLTSGSNTATAAGSS